MSPVPFWLVLVLIWPLAVAGKETFTWGDTYEGAKTKVVQLDCLNQDKKQVCCSAVNQSHTLSRGVGTDYERFIHGTSDHDSSAKHAAGKCEVKKQYIPSPYELRDFQFAKDLELIKDAAVRLDKLLTYVTTDEMIVNSTKWLNRVKIHMQSEVTPTPTPDDFEFLSRFHITKVCKQDAGGEIKTEWDEWIEPLSIHARHPFAWIDCGGLTGSY